MELTKEEDEITKYCKDFCPIYTAVTDYNNSHRPIICCPTEMCERVTEAYILYLREKQLKEE